MNPEATDEFIELLDALCEGRLDESGRAGLHRMLAADPELARTLADHLVISQTLAQFAANESDYVVGLVDHVTRISGENESEFATRIVGKIVRRRRTTWMAIAALITLLVIPAWLVLRQPDRILSGAVATMSHFGGEGNFLSSTPVAVGQEIAAEKGLMKLVFANKAVITIESPTRFKILSANEIRLRSGRLNGWCPPEAHGFKVVTATATLTDLGTSFGIRSTDDGKAEFMVLSGEVTVEKNDQKIFLTEGNAVADSGSSSLTPMIFDPSSFKNTWTLGYGILSTQGAVVPANPDIPEKLLHLEDNSHVLVIPERRGVPFNRPIRAEITSPGTLPGNHDGRLTTLDPTPGMSTTSFLIRYDPVGETALDEFRRFEGEVTFDRPVLAIACQREALEDGDVVFARGNWSSDFRGIELSQINNPPDKVTLSPDRRTVKVVFYAGAATDEVRVILQDN